MNSVINENQLTVVEENEFDNPPIQKIHSLIDGCTRDCHKKYFHTFDHICEYNLKFTIIGINETVNSTISEKKT